MERRSFLKTILLGMTALLICVVFSVNTKAVTINVNAGASAIMDAPLDAEEGQDTIQVDVTEHIPDGVISKGVYADTIDLSSMTYDEANRAITEYVNTLKNTEITLLSVNGTSKVVTAGELGLKWNNTGIIGEAVGLGKEGNIVNRYKALKDLEFSKKIYTVELGFDQATIKTMLEAQAEQDNIEPIDATLSRADGTFSVVPGQTGYSINIDSSANKIIDTLSSEWNKQATAIELAVDVNEPKGKTDELQMVKDVLGTFTTSYKSSGTSRSGNVANGTRLIDGIVLFPGEEFSAYDTVEPFTEENGYFMAGSYLNGLVVESLGGGICQVTSTLYNAVLRAELEVTERSNHSMIVNYVNLSSDAAIAGTYKNFRFVNSLDYPIYIEGKTSEDKKITFTIYGVETRPENREVSFESVELSKTIPEGDKIVADPGQPVGYIDVQSAHTGFVGELWKIVKVDGVETERVKINKSTYTATPRTATVGTATSDPNVATAIQSAIATSSIDYCKSVIAQMNAAAAAAAAGVPAQ